MIAQLTSGKLRVGYRLDRKKIILEVRLLNKAVLFNLRLDQFLVHDYEKQGWRWSRKIRVFRSDSGITLSFGQATYFISAEDPFHNIALKALDQNDYVPFYIEIAKREGVGPEFRDAMEEMIKDALEDN